MYSITIDNLKDFSFYIKVLSIVEKYAKNVKYIYKVLVPLSTSNTLVA